MLSIVSTPIGNLADMTLRARETLARCDAIVCEDTRMTGKLLHLLELPKKDLLPFHSYRGGEGRQGWLRRQRILGHILERLRRGEHLALVCDAGTPGISDPGFLLISKAHEAGIKVEVVPGPSAFLAALSISGLPTHHFVYLGFLPRRHGRRALLASLRNEERTVVFYESPHRIERTLRELHEVFCDQGDRVLVLCRELTKLHEEVLRTTIEELPSILSKLSMKGEFCLVLGPWSRLSLAKVRASPKIDEHEFSSS
jgi:16S rRNA (cytidine1402-2'-O)-methyltransferase